MQGPPPYWIAMVTTLLVVVEAVLNDEADVGIMSVNGYPAPLRSCFRHLEHNLIDAGAAGAAAAVDRRHTLASDRHLRRNRKISSGRRRVVGIESGSEFNVELMGCAVAETKFCRIPGPSPPPLAVKMPKLLFTTRTGDRLLRELLKPTCRDTRPSGAFDGMMALIWPGLKNIGIAST